MKVFTQTLTGVLVLMLAGCGGGNSRKFMQVAATPGKTGTPTPKEAGDSTYRYAVSGQVLDALTKTPIKNFSVSTVGGDSAVKAVLNALGDTNGLFHISRNPSAADATVQPLSVVLSAPGFETVVKTLDVGADCQTTSCAGAKPLALLLKPLTQTLKNTVENTVTSSSLSPSTVTALIPQKGIQNVFAELVNSGKVDTQVQNVLATAKTKDMISQVLVMLKGNTGTQTGDLVSNLLGSISGDKVSGLGNVSSLASHFIPLLATSNPQIGGALLGANMLLPYLTPLISKLGQSQSGPMGNLLASFLGGDGAQSNLMGLVSQLQGGGSQQALAGFLPLIQGFLNKPAGSDKPFEGLLSNILKDPTLLNLISSGANGSVSADQTIPMLMTYLQPLVQGLATKNAPQLAGLFNELIKQDGILALKNFPAGLSDPGKFAQLQPYIEPLIRGLNSEQAPALSAVLNPLISKKNPAVAVRNLLTKGGDGKLGNIAQMAQSLFPAMSPLLNQYVPGKQVFGAQLLQGLVNGDFQGLQVIDDMKGAPAVVLSGQAKDILKLAQLPNVEKIISLVGAGSVPQ